MASTSEYGRAPPSNFRNDERELFAMFQKHGSSDDDDYVGTDCKHWQYATFWRLLRRAQKSRAMPACLALYATDETLMPSQSCPPRSPEPVAPAAPCAKRSRGLTCLCYAVGLLLVFILSLLLLPHDRGLGRLLWGTL